jgi:glutaredoxin 3
MLVYQNMLTIFVTIIMNSSCGLSRYSIRVKKLFDKLGYDFQGIELDELNDEDGVQDALERISGLSTVPNVYIGGKHIGGCDDTVALHMRGELIPLLIAAGANKK